MHNTTWMSLTLLAILGGLLFATFTAIEEKKEAAQAQHRVVLERVKDLFAAVGGDCLESFMGSYSVDDGDMREKAAEYIERYCKGKNGGNTENKGPAEPRRTWFEAQWEAAGGEVRKAVEAKLKQPCMGGFQTHYTTVLDPKVRFTPDPEALLFQAALYERQFCSPCTSVLWQYTRTYQGLGSRYHTHLCAFDNALRLNRPFVSLDGGWIFVNASDCAESNDQCFFRKFTRCPSVFCDSAQNEGQNCVRYAPAPRVQKCEETCLCGKCGSTDKQYHETVWGKHSCGGLRDVPRALGVGGNRTHLWYTSQLMFFMLQPQGELLRQVQQDMLDPYFTEDVVNIHVRRGRLKQPEMKRFFGLEEYVHLAKRWGEGKKFFIQTNDPSVMDDAKRLKEHEFSWTAWNRTGKDLQIHNDPKKLKKRLKEGMVVDPTAWTIHSFRNLWLMLRSPYWICTFSSNWCRLALRLSYATYGSLPQALSLDDWTYDPYTWYTNDYVNKLINSS